MEKHLYQSMYESSKSHWWFKARKNYIEALMKKYVEGKANQILEIGIGTGANIDILKEFGTLQGLDVSDESIRIINEKYPDIKILNKKFPDETIDEKFDLICLFDVLEHIEDDSKAIEKTLQLLKDKGKLIITVPAYQFLWSYHDEIHHHHRRYSKSELSNLLELNNLKINHSGYFNFLLFPLAFIQRAFSKFTVLKDYDPYEKSILNEFFFHIFNLESWFVNKYFPFGLSIAFVAEKKFSNEEMN
ncbi:MAG: class I SAM-dependent methyltransferase [Gammaproteobacteria bacterium]